jgi:hypothetical protein
MPGIGGEDTALAKAPVQAEAVPALEEAIRTVEGMVPVSREMARMQVSEDALRRQQAIGALTRVYDGVVRDTILRFREEIGDFVFRRVKEGEVTICDDKGRRCNGVMEAVPALYGFSYSYLREILRGGKKKALPKAEKETPEEAGGADAVSEAIPAIDFAHLPKGFDWSQIHDPLTRKQKLECLEDVLVQLGLCTAAVSGVLAIVYKAERAAKARLRKAGETEEKEKAKAAAKAEKDARREEAKQRIAETLERLRQKEKAEKAAADEALIAKGAALIEEAPKGYIWHIDLRSALGISPSKFAWLSRKAEKDGRWLTLNWGGDYCSHAYYEKETAGEDSEEEKARRAEINASIMEAAQGSRSKIRERLEGRRERAEERE